MKPSITQKLADHYSSYGTEQLMVCVYRDEAVVYLQVAEDTFNKVFKSLEKIKFMVLTEDPAMSADGLTYCMVYGRNRFAPKNMDWLEGTMINVADRLRKAVPHLLKGGNVPYQDNRMRDHNTVRRYAELLS